MIRNKLSILLTERGLKATKVANDTGIARSTLSKISSNSSEKIEYSTINTLCKYLRITPSEFFEYSPIDVSFYFELGEALVSQKDLNEGATYSVEASGFINFSKYDEKLGSLEFEGVMEDIGPVGYKNNDEYIYGYHISLRPLVDPISFLDQLSVAFQTDIKEQYEKFIVDHMKENPENKDMEYTVIISFEPKIAV